MIELYAKGATDFTKHGIALAATQASVNWQDNGRYDMDMVMPYNPQITIDYGMILRCPVPVQDVGTITLGTVSYWQVSSGQNNVPLYSKLPRTESVRYSGWTPGIGYTAGDKVTYNGQNYSARHAIAPLTDVAPSVSSAWQTISGSRTVAGKTAATLNAGDMIIKTGNYNNTYMKAADTAGHEGFIEISKCTDMSQTDTRTVPGFRMERQSFAITEIQKASNGQTLSVHAEHISYQLGRVMLGDCNISRATPATALMLIRGAMQETYPGAVETNLPDTELVTGDFSWNNAQAAILDPKAGLLANTTGWMIRNDMDVYILAEGDTTASYRITYGTNLKAVKWTGDVGSLVTRIYPIAQTEDGNTLLLPEIYIDTVRTVPYIRPEALKTGLKIGEKEKQEDGSEVKLTEDMVYSRMREQAANRFNIDECDKAEITLEVDWQHLPDTAEYAQYAALRNAAPGEWVQVVNGPLGISTTIRMSGYTYDPILCRYQKGTFGKKKQSPGVASYDIKSGAVTGRAIASGAVSGANMQAGSITAREIEANSITSDLIAARSITSQLIMANAITADEINAGAVTAEKVAANAITAEKIDAGAVTAVKIAAEAVTADKIAANAIDANKIDTNSITAIIAKLGAAHISNGVIDNASIGFANVVDANIQSLIARDAVTDKYFIDKLQVRNAQMVEATVGELVIKASDNNYYRLDIDEYGVLSPTQVTLTAEEIAAGETSDGRGAIIETDLTVADLSASNMKAINALIDKITAARIDVDELWARQAFINALMVQDISSNTYIQSTIGNWVSGSTITQTIDSLDSRISSLGYGTVYMQPEEPDHGELVAGDIWIQTQSSGTWEQVYQDYATWSAIYNGVSTWQTLGGVSIMWVWDGRKWQKQLDNLDADTFETEIQQNAQQIQLLANRTTAVEGDLENKYTIRSGITIEAAGISISGSQYVKIASGGYFQVQTGNFGIDTDSSTYVIWSGASTAASSPFWLKKDGEISATSGTIGGWALAANSLSSGSGSTYMNINSNTSNTYAMWAGAEAVANAPFRVKRDGTVYVTSLIAVGENGTETTVNLRTAGLWKLGYHTVRSYTESDGYCTGMTLSNGTTLNFSSATLSGGWSGGTYTARMLRGGSVISSISTTPTVFASAEGTVTSTTITVNATLYADGVTQKTASTIIDATACYNAGWNDCLVACGISNGGTVYTGTVSYAWDAPHQSANQINVLRPYYAHQVAKK